MPSSLSFSKIFKAFKEARDGGQGLPRLCIVGTGPEHTRVVDFLSAGADEARGGARVVLDAVQPAEFARPPRTSDPWDIVVFVTAGSSPADMSPLLKTARNRGYGVIVLLEGRNAGAWAGPAYAAEDEIARGYGGDGCRPTLESRIVHAADHAAGALAAHLPAIRRAYCDHVILTNAKQNGVIGAVVIIPGADMPAMTANQIRMVLQIAAAHREEIGVDRAVEILSIVGSAFAFRALARQALSFVPGFGWALKGAVGFSATVALGRATIAYFDAGAPLQVSHMKRIDHQVERVRTRLPGIVQRRMAGK